MDALKIVLDVILVLTSVFLIMTVLMHKGKGGGLSAVFGGGMQSNLSGSTVAEKNLDRLTIVTAVLWFLSIVGLNLVLNFNL